MKNSPRLLAAVVKLTLVVLMGIATHVSADPQLNGVATHSELGNEQFVAGLFTTTLSDSANTILSSQENKRLQVRVLASRLSTRRFRRMWIEGMAINSSPTELEKHARDMADFSNMLKVKLVQGDIFSVDRTEEAVRVSINGVLLGEIEDLQFFDLLLRTWIGPVPLSSDFREDLLTAGSIKPGPLVRFESTIPSEERIAAIESAIAVKQQTAEENEKEEEAPKVAVSKPKVSAPAAPKIAAPIAAPTIPGSTSASGDTDKPEKLALAAPKVDSSPATPKPTPKPKPAASAPKQAALDTSIFDDEGEDEEFTAEGLLKEQLYYSQLAKYTHKFLEYPARAWDRGREGNIRLRVTIDRSGKVKNAEILDEAKYKSLNKEAKRAVFRASPYPAVPKEIKGEEYDFTFRIVFKITG